MSMAKFRNMSTTVISKEKSTACFPKHGSQRNNAPDISAACIVENPWSRRV